MAAARLQVAMAAGVEETLPLPAVVLGVPSGQVVVGLSCVFEDAWETQAGVVISFLALFGAFQRPAQTE